jgi:anti-sigma28 factor (negative regulator of flagellin synthesis)
MKIDDRVSNYMAILTGDLLKSAPKAKDNASVPSSPGVVSDKVTLSTAATQMGNDDEARRTRLIAIQRQLSEGTYNISGKDVADKIIKVLKS